MMVDRTFRVRTVLNGGTGGGHYVGFGGMGAGNIREHRRRRG
ncbi:MAG TPA: molecular chaperone DnaJ, partial [Nitrospira sp.]|nr:molecular chaperone DnaJ [Nitrospira sp.]